MSACVPNENRIKGGVPCDCEARPEVKDSRPRYTKEGNPGKSRRRRYRCPECRAEWTYVEVLIQDAITDEEKIREKVKHELVKHLHEFFKKRHEPIVEPKKGT